MLPHPHPPFNTHTVLFSLSYLHHPRSLINNVLTCLIGPERLAKGCEGSVHARLALDTRLSLSIFLKLKKKILMTAATTIVMDFMDRHHLACTTTQEMASPKNKE